MGKYIRYFFSSFCSAGSRSFAYREIYGEAGDGCCCGDDDGSLFHARFFGVIIAIAMPSISAKAQSIRHKAQGTRHKVQELQTP
jgi:hypothetical protein